MKNKSFFALLLTIAAVITLHACAGMGTMRGDNVRVYNETVDKMVDITERAIRSNSYSIISIEQRNQANQRTIIRFAKRSTAGQQMVSSMQASVFLAKVDTANAVEVQVNNPKYNYGTPTDQRIDYAEMLFTEIDKLLE
ncbi:hypothetical protein [Rhodohalobacter sp. 8-1]|uniref:hypothetical protein n=1 Tax=Rhodohalobacter sp. 8-1 TaxID=3131972 RepID=UPI0030ECA5FF